MEKTPKTKFEVTVLGCGSATPTPRHNPSAQIVNIHDKLSLVDCGEGTQLQMRTCRQKFMALRNVFISHLHGDHCLGLVGLISSYGLLGRTMDFHVYAHAELQPLLDAQLNLFCHSLDFEVVFHPVDPKSHALIYEDRSMEIWSLPLKHSMPCNGFLFREKPALP
ncbi:MAG: ribonuclease Z, partial [Bacteroidaceae bacterium]|nr:ribonuclease Z [Bacteroidaceae bacterium]